MASLKKESCCFINYFNPAFIELLKVLKGLLYFIKFHGGNYRLACCYIMWLFKDWDFFFFLLCIMIFPKKLLEAFWLMQNWIIWLISWLSFVPLDFVTTPLTILLLYNLNLHLGWAKEARREEFVVIAFTCWFTVLHESHQH